MTFSYSCRHAECIHQEPEKVPAHWTLINCRIGVWNVLCVDPPYPRKWIAYSLMHISLTGLLHKFAEQLLANSRGSIRTCPIAVCARSGLAGCAGGCCARMCTFRCVRCQWRSQVDPCAACKISFEPSANLWCWQQSQSQFSHTIVLFRALAQHHSPHAMPSQISILSFHPIWTGMCLSPQQHGNLQHAWAASNKHPRYYNPALVMNQPLRQLCHASRILSMQPVLQCAAICRHIERAIHRPGVRSIHTLLSCCASAQDLYHAGEQITDNPS